jgi:hypothetical protein
MDFRNYTEPISEDFIHPLLEGQLGPENLKLSRSCKVDLK